ncbi:MAG: transglutaminase-like domain-containing protein [Fuerstiella sp.]
MPNRFKLIAVLTLLLCVPTAFGENTKQAEQAIEKTLQAAGTNRSELQMAIEQIEPNYRPGLQFLLQYMPKSDARKLTANFLLEHVRGAYLAKEQAPWKAQLTEDVFLNYILPYANVSEKRQAWRDDFRKRFLPLVKDAKTPSAAAVILNQRIFPLTHVKYSTKRRRADQGPYETIDSGLASCTGLSILLIDACRSVGIPARFVGTPSWSDDSGNHSWIEIWDNGWQFTGAAEPTGDKLNAGWFSGRASKAKVDQRKYAVYAVSYRRTDTVFPMVWSVNADPVWATNVTSGYTKSPITLKSNQVLVHVTAIDASKRRLTTEVKVLDDKQNVVAEGKTLNEGFDTNNYFSVVLNKNSDYSIQYSNSKLNQSGQTEFKTGSDTTKKPIVVQLTAPAAK